MWVTEFNVEVDFISTTARAVSPRTQVYAYETCDGRKPTILGAGVPDVIYGTPGDDVIIGGAGNDRIDGAGGNDTICGGRGKTCSSAEPARTSSSAARATATAAPKASGRSSCESR